MRLEHPSPDVFCFDFRRAPAHSAPMKPLLFSRRKFVGLLPAWVCASALLRNHRLAAATSAPRVGCQANGFPIKPGDFPALLAALKKMKELGYTGFECN